MNKDNKKNKKKIKDLLMIACYLLFMLSVVLVLGISVYMFIYRIQNPTLTETQITIYSIKKFWWLYVMFIGSYIGFTYGGR